MPKGTAFALSEYPHFAIQAIGGLITLLDITQQGDEPVILEFPMIAFKKTQEGGLTYVQPLPRGLHVDLQKRMALRQRLVRVIVRVVARPSPLDS